MNSTERRPASPDPATTEGSSADRWLRLALAAFGVAEIGWGVLLLITRVRIPDWFRLVGWGIAGIAINDALMAPAAMVIGALLLRRVPVAYRWPLRSGLLATGCLSIMILIAAGARRYRQNPTVVPTDPLQAATITAVTLAIIIVMVELALIISRHRERNRAVDR